MAFANNVPLTTNQIANDLVAINANWELTAPGVVTTAGDIVYATGNAAIARLAIGTSGQVLVTNAAATAPEWQSGHIVQVASSASSALGAEKGTTGTTAMPGDDTIPQNTEGDEYLTCAITPRDADNTLNIHVILNMSNSNDDAYYCAALFQDTTANALCSSVQKINATDPHVAQMVLFHTMTAGTASETTFKVRAGDASGGTTTVNGYGGARLHGGVLYSSIVIYEMVA